jgi:xanthine dehydrogenase accessory factor
MKIFRASAHTIQIGQPAALATVIGVDGSAPRSSGSRMLILDDGEIVGTVGGGAFEQQVIAVGLEVIASNQPRRFHVHLTRDLGMCCGGAMEVFIEPLTPQPHLVIFGAGHVARPTGALALDLGFRVTVIDERDDWATTDRFPDCALVVRDPKRALEELTVDSNTYLLIVTHDHALDQYLLEALIVQRWAWLGLIGSRAKVTKFFLRLRAAGIDETLFERVSAPVGLDLGAETPEEIAVSIHAELIRVRRQCARPPFPLAELGRGRRKD